MVENQKNQQGQANQKTQQQDNKNQQHHHAKKEGQPLEQKITADDENEEGTKMPGRETHTPVARKDDQKHNSDKTGNQKTTTDKNAQPATEVK